MGFFKTLTGKILAYNDGTQAAPGFDRAAMGNLDDYTGPDGVNSPAQAGFRALDSLGNAIFDSMGLIAVMKVLGTVNPPNAGPVAGVPTGYVLPGSTLQFFTTRPANVFFLASMNVSGDAANIPAAFISQPLAGVVGPSVYGCVLQGQLTNNTPMTLWAFARYLGAASVNLTVSQPAGNFFYSSATMVAFLLGS